jgi:hypothetical protein
MGACLTRQILQRSVQAVADGGQRDARACRLLFTVGAASNACGRLAARGERRMSRQEAAAAAPRVHSRFGVNIRVD